MATIRIVDLKVRTIIGVHAWERANKQELLLNITLEYDAAQACQSDKLSDALNYEAVAIRVMKLVERSRYLLLEKLTARVLQAIMADKRVEGAFVRIDKPQAIPQARYVSFELFAERQKA